MFRVTEVNMNSLAVAIEATAKLAVSQSASRSVDPVMQLQGEDEQAMGRQQQQQRLLGAH